MLTCHTSTIRFSTSLQTRKLVNSPDTGSVMLWFETLLLELDAGASVEAIVFMS